MSFCFNSATNDFNLEYLEIVLQLVDLNRFKVISAQPSISQNNIKNIPIPFPSKETQAQIANHISGLKSEIKRLKKQAEQNRKQAIVDFEKEIFS